MTNTEFSNKCVFYYQSATLGVVSWSLVLFVLSALFRFFLLTNTKKNVNFINYMKIPNRLYKSYHPNNMHLEMPKKIKWLLGPKIDKKMLQLFVCNRFSTSYSSIFKKYKRFWNFCEFSNQLYKSHFFIINRLEMTNKTKWHIRWKKMKWNYSEGISNPLWFAMCKKCFFTLWPLKTCLKIPMLNGFKCLMTVKKSS